MQTLAEHNAAIAIPLETRYRNGELRFEETDLIYSATERCSCGAGLARLTAKECTLRFWHCSRCLLEGINAPNGPHEDLKPLYRFDIQEEGPVPSTGLPDDLSAPYLSTRPNAEYTVYTIQAGGTKTRTADEAVAKDDLFRLAMDYRTVTLTRRRYPRKTIHGSEE